MIKISVDEGYAYDVLSINQVKQEKNIKNSKKYIEILNYDIINSIGEELHRKIINSNEYKNLLEANKDTFDAVEKARYSLISAKEVDDCNLKRYKYKLELQNKFFKSSEILENKS